MTNDPVDNEVVRLSDTTGTGLTVVDSTSTGGMGIGTLALPDLSDGDGVDPLVSQGALHKMGRHLLAVNAGSGSVSVLDVAADGSLTLADQADVEGYPNSIASRGGDVYVAMSPGATS
jgi:hypothetical protein